MTVSVGAASYPRDGAQQDDVQGAAALRRRRDRELRQANAARPTAEGAT
jgi:hypothetical protein